MKPAFHSRYGAALRRAAAVSAHARATGAPLDEIDAQLDQPDQDVDRRFDRRTLLKGMGAAGGAVAVAPLAARRHEKQRLTTRAKGAAPRIVIVGGGLAGIRCAHKLWTQKGVASTIYEWDDRLGGRVDTLRGLFANGEDIERCGEFISSEHKSMIALTKHFGLTLDNTNAYPRGTANTYWLNGHRYTQAQLNSDWQTFGYSLFHDMIGRVPWPTTYQTKTPTSIALDNMSAAEWIDANVPGGLAGDFGRLCYLDVESEYGGAPEEQSALNVIYLLGYDDSVPKSNFQPKRSPVLGGSDERFHTRGGNDQVVTGLVSELPGGAALTGQQLVALKDNGNATYTCTFDVDGVASDVVADHVVLTLPFQKLAEVDLSQANLSPLKMTAINGLKLGSNAKVAIQVAGKPWNADGYNGNMFAENLTLSGWDDSISQPPSPTAIFFDYLGGKPGLQLAHKFGLTSSLGTAPDPMIQDYLNKLERLYPGFTAAWEAGPKLAYYSDPNINPKLGGAYTQYLVGQYTGFSGIEETREGNIHFAGEHTSQDFQGFMEGAVTTGERAALEIL